MFKRLGASKRPANVSVSFLSSEMDDEDSIQAVIPGELEYAGILKPSAPKRKRINIKKAAQKTPVEVRLGGCGHRKNIH